MAAMTYQCPNCGGGLAFDPQSQMFKCEYCLSDFSKEDMERFSGGGDGISREPDQGEEEASVYVCPSCGAEVMADETTAATICYYCHNPVVLVGRLVGKDRPGYMIPFSIEREKAEEIFNNWIGEKWFVPKDFHTKGQVESLTGVYFPYWLYSCRVDGGLEGEAVRTKSWKSGGSRYVMTQIFRVERQGGMDVRHVPRSALKKDNGHLGHLIEGVLPFRFEELKRFGMPYLSGFMAENRNIEWQEIAPELEEEVRQYASESLKGTVYGYDRFTPSSLKAAISEPEWDLALLPVWTMTYKHANDGKMYYFALNGQTGKVCGVLPVSRERLMALFLCVFFIVAVALVLLQMGYD